MHLETLNLKQQQQTKAKSHIYKTKDAEVLTIPDSWRLNELQRSFIDSMADQERK